MRHRDIGRGSVDSLSHARLTIDRLLTDYRPTVDLLSIVILTAISTDISVDITYSKQDPVHLQTVELIDMQWSKIGISKLGSPVFNSL